jgi:hypothetical protein
MLRIALVALCGSLLFLGCDDGFDPIDGGAGGGRGVGGGAGGVGGGAGGVGGGAGGVGGGAGGVGGGAGGGGGGAGGGVGGGSGGADFAIFPAATTVPSYGQMPFVAQLLDGGPVSVTWALEEPDAGWLLVSDAGVAAFESSGQLGLFHVSATSNGNVVRAEVSVDDTVGGSIFLEPSLYGFAGSLTAFGVSLNALASQTFTAFLSMVSPNAVATDVTWSIVEPGQGSVNDAGTYTSPNHSGTYHLLATMPIAARSVMTEIAVVNSGSTSIAVAPEIVHLAPNASIQLSAQVFGGTSSINWFVMGGNSTYGTVTSGGYYSAPNRTGVFLVKASHGLVYAYVTVIVQ